MSGWSRARVFARVHHSGFPDERTDNWIRMKIGRARMRILSWGLEISNWVLEREHVQSCAPDQRLEGRLVWVLEREPFPTHFALDLVIQTATG